MRVRLATPAGRGLITWACGQSVADVLGAGVQLQGCAVDTLLVQVTGASAGVIGEAAAGPRLHGGAPGRAGDPGGRADRGVR